MTATQVPPPAPPVAPAPPAGMVDKPAVSATPATPASATPAPATPAAPTIIGAPKDGYKFQAQDGSPLPFAPKVLEAFGSAAKALDLNQGAAQQVLDHMLPAMLAHHKETMQARAVEWKAAALADKEIGGEKLEENLGAAKAAMVKLGGEPLMKLLENEPLLNHPEFIRPFLRASRLLSQDSKLVAGNPSAPPTDAAHILYPSLK